MASITINRPDLFPSGTSVSAYAATGTGATPSSGAPAGSAAATATVAGDGSLSLTGLASGTTYILYAASPDRYLRINTGASSTGVGAPGGAAPEGGMYFEKDAAGQTVALWQGSSGSWSKVLGPGPYASLTTSIAGSVANNVETAISFDTVREDTDGMYSAGNPTRLTIKRAGIYTFEWRARFVSGTTTGTRHWWLQKNGVANNYLAFVILNGTDVASTSPFLFPLSVTDRFAINDFVEAGLFQNSGAALNFDKFDPMVPEFRAFFVRP